MPKGYRDLGTSIQAYVTVRGKFYQKTFPLETKLTTINGWRERKRAELKYGVPRGTVESSSFTADASRYLELVTGMPSYVDRKKHIDDWAEAFGTRPRSSIAAADIREVLERWRVKKHLSAGSLNRRRTALMAMYTTLDGKAAPNVVKDVQPYSETHSQQIRAFDMLTIARIIRRVPPNSDSRGRLQFLHWTGLPSKLLMQIREPDIDWDRSRVKIAARGKGKGMASGWVPLLPRAMSALRHLRRRRALGRDFSGSGLYKTWGRAWALENDARAAKDLPPLPPIRVYDIRHSFATWAAGKIKDDRALAELLRTNSIKRYTEGAKAERLALAVKSLR